MQSYRLSLSVLWLLPNPLRGNITIKVDLFKLRCTFTVATVRLKLCNKLPGIWDERTPRGRFRGRLVEQLSRITVVVIGMLPVSVIRVTLCYNV
jgi:hypothetical protein